MMKQCVLSAAMMLLSGVEIVYAENLDVVSPNDTIRTYNIDEVILTSSTKETNDLRTLPAAVSILSPQQIAGRQIDALMDISSLVPNLFIPDYGAKLTSAVYIRGIGARSSGQSIGMYVDNVPYLDKSTFDFELTDIQRIEVLRGPQGTLYGRNAMGGIVNVYTLSPFDFQGKRVLDLGCGYGWHCQYATEHHAQYVLGVDISKRMLETAKQKHAHPQIEYRQIAMEDLTLEPDSFDVVFSSLALHYVKDYEQLVQHILYRF